MTEPARSRVDPDALRAVAMFPLSEVVLLPGALLPLHIFEPRYRQMTRDVLEGSRLIAMARLRGGDGGLDPSRPPVHDVVGVGEVIGSQDLPDGRYNILVRGRIRARVIDELTPELPYRVVRASPIDDVEPPVHDILTATHQDFLTRCDRLAEILDDSADKLRELARAEPDPGLCADMMAAALVTSPDELQALLENRDPVDRLAFLIRHVTRLVREHGDAPPPRSN